MRVVRFWVKIGGSGVWGERSWFFFGGGGVEKMCGGMGGEEILGESR